MSTRVGVLVVDGLLDERQSTARGGAEPVTYERHQCRLARTVDTLQHDQGPLAGRLVACFRFTHVVQFQRRVVQPEMVSSMSKDWNLVASLLGSRRKQVATISATTPSTS